MYASAPGGGTGSIQRSLIALSAGFVRHRCSLSRSMAEPRLAFKAGRAFRREGTNWVDHSATKGAIILQNGEDGLLHFIWKNRATQNIEEVRVVQKILFISNRRGAGFNSVPRRRELRESSAVILG